MGTRKDTSIFLPSILEVSSFKLPNLKNIDSILLFSSLVVLEGILILFIDTLSNLIANLSKLDFMLFNAVESILILLIVIGFALTKFFKRSIVVLISD